MSLFKRKDAEEDENQDTQEEAEEALSLRDLPINDRGMKLEDISNTADPTAPDQDLFEFFNNFNSKMCAADDIFLCGMLLPYKSSLSTKTRNEEENRSFLHMRSESFDETRRSSAKCRIMRSSLSVDCRKLERDSSSSGSSSMAKNSQMTNRVPSEKCELSSRRRPKWYLLMFGSMRSPAEMEMKDIRNRLRRRDPRTTVLFPELEKRGREVAVGKEEGKRAWKLLRALSCKGHANAVVTPSFGSIQHVPSM